MRIPRIPAWFPLRTLILELGLTLCAALFCLVPLSYLSWRLETDITGLEARIQVQETLQPLMEGLDGKREETRRLIGATKILPAPDTLPRIVTSLQELVDMSGMQSARFVPAAETVVEKNSIRLDGTLSGDPDAFRRLVLLLSEQPWLSGMEFLDVTPTGTLPSYSLGIWATFTQRNPSH